MHSSTLEKYGRRGDMMSRQDKKINTELTDRLTLNVNMYFIIMALFVIITAIKGYMSLALTEGLIFAVLLVYHIFHKSKKQKQIEGYVENLEFHLNNTTKDSLVHLPLPVTILDLSGTFVWYNKKFKDIAEENLFDQSITDIIPEIEILKILENREKIIFDTQFKGRFFQVIGSVVGVTDNKSTSYSIILYWIDKTNEKLSIKLREDSMPVTCLLTVDNYEDLISSNANNDNSDLIATIDKNIHTWVSAYGGISMKYEKDKYFILFEKANLDEIENHKFSILNVSREIKVGNTIPVTLSIGIGKGDNLSQCNQYAKAALDMALGRGGDQAVVRDAKNFTFFGGHSESLEKNTRVRARVFAQAFRELVSNSDKVFISGHHNADFDSFGAAVGIARAVKLCNKKPYIIVDGIQNSVRKIYDVLKDEPELKDVFITESDAAQLYTKISLFVVLDTHSTDFVQAQKLLKLIPNVVLIDHHRRSADYIDNPVLTFHEPFASSTCEMVTEVLQYISENTKLTPKEAEALYAGIALDTKNFAIKTGVRTFDAAAYLRRCGVNTVDVKRLFQNDLNIYKKRAGIIANASIYKDNIAISCWNETEKEPNVLTSQSADELLNISGISASFVLCRNGENIVISGRSLGNYNVQVVLEQLGGGGHMTVAGAQLKNTSMDNAVKMLKEAIDKVN